MRSANALLEMPQAKGVLAAGTRVTALLIGDLGAHMPISATAKEIEALDVRPAV